MLNATSPLRIPLLACGLALKDWFFERTLSLCAVVALASMLSPLLVLNGVRVGFVENLRQNLLKDPSALIIMPAGSGAAGYTLSQLGIYRQRPDVRFVIPRTRAVASELLFTTPEGDFRPLSLEPTDAGDPLLTRGNVPIPMATLPVSQVVLSTTAAHKLHAQTEQEITARLGRKTPAGKLESRTLTFQVVGILPASVTALEAAFMPLTVLEDIQDYRDYMAVPHRHFEGDIIAEGPRQYESFRLYARSIDDVEALESFFVGQHLPVITKAKNVADIRLIDTALTRIIGVIALAVAFGFVAFTLSSVHASVRRKVKMLAMLRLLGFTRWALLCYPVVQVVTTTILGTSLAGLFALGVGMGIDTLFALPQAHEALCVLYLTDFLWATGIVLLLSLVATLQPALKSAHVEPAQVLRDM